MIPEPPGLAEFAGDARRHKADEALRMMRLLEMLPILRDQGVL